jgi:hypothetical protein
MTTMPPAVDIGERPIEGLALVKPRLIDYLWICTHLPEVQRRQYEALTDCAKFDVERVAMSFALRAGPQWALVKQDGTPIAVGGYDMIRNGVWQDFLLTTDEAWTHHAIAVTRACRKIMATMLDGHAHRLQAILLADRADVRKWYRLLDLKFDGDLPGFGAHGEDAVIYSRIKQQVQHV